jgi:hypothetical protein
VIAKLSPSLRRGVVVVADDPRNLPRTVLVSPEVNELPFANWLGVLMPRVVEAVNPHLHRAIVCPTRSRRSRADKTKAKSAYQDFLTLWKAAGSDIPILKEARAEFAKLQ